MAVPPEAAEILDRVAHTIQADPHFYDDERFNAFIVYCHQHDLHISAQDVAEFLRTTELGRRADADKVIEQYVSRYQPGRELLAFYDQRQRADA